MQQTQPTTGSGKIRFIYAIIFIVGLIFVGRLFQLQIIRHGYYQAQAQANQFKQYTVAAERGDIYAMDGGEVVPLVLNEKVFRLVADPQIIDAEDIQPIAERVASVIGGDASSIAKSLSTKESRYEIIAKKQPKKVKESIDSLVADGDIYGVFVEETSQRVYPQGAIAAQLLGFVDDEGKGQYGIEQAMNDTLAGTPGTVTALTDQNGVPLLASADKNIIQEPIDGKDVYLSIDVAMQRQLETTLKQGLDKALSTSGSSIIIDPKTGRVKAMANYPSYDPAAFSEVEDKSLFNNAAVAAPLEPGSVMKVLTTAAALQQGVVTIDQPYFDPGFYRLDGATITNVAEVSGAASRTIADVMRLSLNTGATHLLEEMGDGQINEKARLVWYDYMTNRYGLGAPTGIEQSTEVGGYVPSPTDGFGLNIQYANTTFGQGMSATPLQMISAVSSVINGGTYYRPTLVTALGTQDVLQAQEPEVVVKNVVSPEVSSIIVRTMGEVIALNNRPAARTGYSVGGKTGTAQIARPEGGYYEDRFNGTYTGFVGGDTPEYAVIVLVNQPGIPGYAGSKAAGPVFASVVNMLIDNFGVRPKTDQ